MKELENLCAYIETFKELVAVESLTNMNPNNRFSADIYKHSIIFPVVYFYEKTDGRYDMYECDHNYFSKESFKELRYHNLLEKNPQLVEMTVEELQRDYPEYLI